MLYGLAHSSVQRESDVAAMSSTAQGPTKCADGFAAGFPCDGVDLIAHLPLSAFRTSTGEAPAAANDLWGWTHEKREFVIWGVSEASRRDCSSSNARSRPVACAAPAYEQAIALRPLVPFPRRDRRQHWLTSCPHLSVLCLMSRKYYVIKRETQYYTWVVGKTTTSVP